LSRFIRYVPAEGIVTTHLGRIRRGLVVGAILGTAALPVPAQAHNPTFKGTIEHGWGGLRNGNPRDFSMTVEALKQNSCASTTFQGRDWNNFDAAVIPVAGLEKHSITVTWKDQGNTGNTGKAGSWVHLLDASCAKKPLPEKPMQNPQYMNSRGFVMPAGMKWLLLQPDAGVSGVEYTVVAKDPPKPKPKPRRR